MESYRDDLKSLIELKKKKKELNKDEKTKFASAWNDLVNEEGFSEDAEKFLYDGISCCGAVPFWNYMKAKENPVEALEELYNGKLYNKSCANTAPLLLHLLCLCMNERNDDYPVAISLMSHIPEAMINKEGDLYGQANRTLRKYFINELKDDLKLPDIAVLLEHGLTQDCLDKFSYVIGEAVEETDPSGLSEDAVGKIDHISKWLFPDGIPTDLADRAGINKESGKKKGKSKKNNQNNKDEIKSLQRKISRLTAQKAQDNLSLKALTNENCNLKQTVDDISKDLNDKKDYIAELSHEKRDLASRVDSLGKENKELQDKLDKSMEMVEMLRRDRQKQTDENQKKVSSKLKEYYQDYVDAKDLEMSTDLGENLRDQLGEVMEILSSAGILVK